MNASAPSPTVRITLTVEVPVALVEKSVRALFEFNPHYEENFLFHLTRGGYRDQNPFFTPSLIAVDAVCPGLAAAYRRRKEIADQVPWSVDYFVRRWEYGPGEWMMADGREIALRVHFPRTYEERHDLRDPLRQKPWLVKYPLDPVQFANSYVLLQAESARIAASRLGNHDHAAMFKRQATELEDLAAAIIASADSPVDLGCMIVTRAADGTVLTKQFEPMRQWPA